MLPLTSKRNCNQEPKDKSSVKVTSVQVPPVMDSLSSITVPAVETLPGLHRLLFSRASIRRCSPCIPCSECLKACQHYHPIAPCSPCGPSHRGCTIITVCTVRHHLFHLCLAHPVGLWAVALHQHHRYP